jgi:hypothetical protein
VKKFILAIVVVLLVLALMPTVVLADGPGNSEPGGDRYEANPGRQQAGEVGAQCGSGAGSGSFGYFGKGYNLGNETSGHYKDGGQGADGYQTGLNNSGVCGNRP